VLPAHNPIDAKGEFVIPAARDLFRDSSAAESSGVAVNHARGMRAIAVTIAAAGGRN
jgi:hypothetical protein